MPAWYNKGKNKKKGPASSHTVQCVHCKRHIPALQNTWVCNGRGEVLCSNNNGRDCFNEVRKLRENNDSQGRQDAGEQRRSGEVEFPY